MDTDKKKALSIQTIIISSIIFLFLGIGIGYFIDQRGAKIAQFKIKNGENELSINLDQEQISEKDLLKQMFSEEWTRDASSAWLRKNQEIFHYKHLDLIESIKKLRPNIDIRISENFRELSRKRQGPWDYQTDTISIGFPLKAPVEGKAFGCENGDYYRQKVKLYSLNGRNEVIVEVTNKYECPNGFEVPDIQISKEDRIKLFGDTPVSKTEKVFALIIND